MKRWLILTLLIGTAARADSPMTHEQSDALAAEAARLAPASTTVVQPLPPVPPSLRSVLGSWSELIAWTPHIPVTCAQLPDGRLLTFASSERTTFPVGTFTYAATWDYRTGEFVEINNPRHDMFCGGVSLLPDGRLLVNGGNNTIRDCSVFDWRTNQWASAPDMNDARWYNTSVALPDGTVFTASGSGGSDTAEHWREGYGWTRYPDINWALAHNEANFESIWHPLLHVAPDGRIAHTGPTRTMHWVNPAGEGEFISTSASVAGSYYPKDGAVVMFNEGKILHAAGRTHNGGASRLAYVIDVNGSTPVATQTGSLEFARTFANGVILPNGEVMAVGGNTSQEKFVDTGSVLTPEIWNPTTGMWRKAAGMQVPRNYHSLAVLLPDGRVWSGGGGLSGTITDHQDAQIHTPAALYKSDGTLATRPEITEAPAAIGPAMTFAVRATAGVRRFTFIKLASLTHSVGSDLRFLELPFTEHAPGAYAVQSRANLNVMTPGYWMLFAIAANGPYSVSKTIRVDASLTHSISHPPDQVTTIGDTVSLAIHAEGHSPTSRVFSATGLPAGLAIDPHSGLITGTASATGFHDVTVTVDDGVIAPASASFRWNVHSDLKVAALSHPPVPSGTAFELSATTTGSANPEFQWDFGDGSPATGFSSNATITKTYVTPGRHIVTLTVRDDTGSRVVTSYRQAVHAPLTPKPPAVSSSIAYQTRGTGNPRLWVVNPDQDSVAVFDAVTRGRVTVIATGRGPRSVAIAPDGQAWIANSEGNNFSIIGTNLAVARTIPLPRGSRPFAVVFDPAGQHAYVSLQDSGMVLKINPAAPTQIVATATVGRDVRHLSLTADGTRLFATRFITPPLPGESTAHVITEQNGEKFGGEVLAINTADMSVFKTIILGHNNDEDSSITSRGIPNYLGPAVISPDGGNAWIPSKQDNLQRGLLRDGRPLMHDSAVRSIVSRIDLNVQAEDHAARIDFNDAGIASTAAYDPTGMYLFTALEGSREIAVVDAWGKRQLLRFTTGRAPQGVVTSPDGRTLYVQNFMDRNVTVHDVGAIMDGAERAPRLIATLNCLVREKLPATVLKGKQLFHDARDQRLALQQYISCASCHNDGDQDGRVWDFTGFGEGLRNNISLKGHATHGPAHWTGNFDEIQDFEGQIRGFAGGLGLMSDTDFHAGTRDQPLGDLKAGISADLDALAAYVGSLRTVGGSPHRNSNGSLTADAVAGQQIFREKNCAACHGGSRFTNSALNVFRDIGTIKPATGRRLNGPITGLDVPTLRGLWSTAPYLHDGSAATLADAVRAHQGMSMTDDQIVKVVAFLSQIDDAILTAPSPLNVIIATIGDTVNAPFPVTGVLSERANGFTASDIRITGGSVSGFSLSGTTFSFTVTPQAASLRLDIPANAMIDSTGLGNLASNVLHLTNTGDTTPPSIQLETTSDPVSGAFEVTLRASEDVTGLESDDIIVSNGIVSNLNGDGSVHTLTITPDTDGEVTVSLPAGAVSDAAGNPNTASNVLRVNFAAIADPPPTVTLTFASGINNGTVVLNAQFTEEVSGLSEDDFNITNGTVIGLSGSGSLWLATIQTAGTGDLVVHLPADAAQDSATQGNRVSNVLKLANVTAANFAAKINFQNVGAPLPAGFITDTGALLGPQNGLEYGWNVSQSATARDRSLISDQRQDTLIRLSAAARWEIAVPNGEYDVVVGIGDAAMASTNSLRVEDTTAWSAFTLAAGRFDVKTLRVTVMDDRLTLDHTGAADGATALNFIEITKANASPSVGRDGLTADYFAGRNFEQLRVSRIDRCIDFAWNAAAPDARVPSDDFSVRWQGCLIPRFSERHTLSIINSGGVRLWLDDRLIINQWADHGEQSHSVEIDLHAGTATRLRMEFFHSAGDATARLLWSSDNQPLEVVPSECLRINDSGLPAPVYPATFTEWLQSSRSNGADGISTATTNADGDDLPDLLEYALGGSAGSGISTGEWMHFDTQDGHISASIVRPRSISDLRWTLESSTDLRTWTPLIIAPVVIDNGGDTQPLRWSNLDTLPGQNLAGGMVRLTVQLLPAGEVAASAPFAWQRIVTQSGTQTVGINVVNPPVFAGRAHSSAGSSVYLTDACYLPGVADPDARYYLEIRGGAHAGHHFDLAHIGDRALVIDTESANNTLPEVPADIAGASIAIHRHITLGQVFDKRVLTGSNSAAQADQVLFLEATGFRTFWLLKSGSRMQWLAAGDATLADAGRVVIPPGTGVMLKSNNGAQKSLLITGQVRTTPFTTLATPGYSLFANPWPMDTSPAALNMTASVFAATTNPATADTFQLWKGDSQAGAGGYNGYWFFGRANRAAIWVSSGDATLVSKNQDVLFKAGRSAFLVRRGATSSMWQIPAP
ncbi:MAG: DUF1929 domain-containing protein [Prosthecobacter sp.]|jgi:PKD repeat protein|uniref:Ig-like domain-containing protein n=1 Tax=Prosthecobacter sp. TaxID=1965333 RepID=UPI0019DFE4DA|nr:Ig-like domain-containing protein [Prosthecobacter sp.]MBE2286001.1 DUF1929 domain-containing protein [Prosthecobacter sp.]